MSYSDCEMDVLDSVVKASGLDSKACRKRQRLDHLTAEEKLLRRKMKNRAAAQNARDRKKAHMDDLEAHVIMLQKENHDLHADNDRLKQAMAEQQRQIEELQKLCKTAAIATSKQTVPTTCTCKLQAENTDELKSSLTIESFEHAEGPGLDCTDDTSSLQSVDAVADDVDVKSEADDEEQHLSLFDDNDLVALLLEGSSESASVKMESAPVENLDHVYHKQQPSTPAVVTEQLMLPFEDPMSPLSSQCPRSPLSTCSSSGYESDHTGPITWEESFTDLFPDLA